MKELTGIWLRNYLLLVFVEVDCFMSARIPISLVIYGIGSTSPLVLAVGECGVDGRTVRHIYAMLLIWWGCDREIGGTWTGIWAERDSIAEAATGGEVGDAGLLWLLDRSKVPSCLAVGLRNNGRKNLTGPERSS